MATSAVQSKPDPGNLCFDNFFFPGMAGVNLGGFVTEKALRCAMLQKKKWAG